MKVRGSGWDIRWLVPWNVDKVTVKLLPQGGLEVEWPDTESGRDANPHPAAADTRPDTP